MCSEETQKKILESDIFRILKSEGVTEIGALYKVSPSKFVLVFGSKTAKEKLESTEIQCRFGDSEICLNFHKRVGPLRNGREPIFVTIFLPEFISDQAVKLAFSEFGDVISVFKGKHRFNKDIRNGKRHVKIFPAGEDPAILPRKITFHGRIQRDVLFAEKVVLCCRCKTRHMLGENCPVATPTAEDSDMSFAEQSDALLGVLLLSSRSPLSRFSLQLSLSRHLLPLVKRLRRGTLPGRVGLALAPIQVQAQSLTMRVSLIWSPRLELVFLRRILLTCLLGRTSLLSRGLRLIRDRTLKGRERFLPRKETKLKRNPQQLTLKN